jgi:hypothetical protein
VCTNIHICMAVQEDEDDEEFDKYTSSGQARGKKDK